MLVSHREKTVRHLRRPLGPIARDLHGTGGRGPLVVCVPDHRRSFRGVGAGPAAPAVEAPAEEVVAGA